MRNRIWASAVLMVGMGMMSCDSTSSTHVPQVYVADSQPTPVRAVRPTLSQPDPTDHRSASSATQPKRVTRVARATSPRYIPPASPSFETPKEAPRRRPPVAQPVVLPGERLMADKGGAKSYSIKIGGIEWVSLELWGKAHNGWFGQLQKGGNDFYRLVVSGMRFDLRPRKRLITCQGMQIWMGFGPEMIGGHLYVHHLDVKKHLAPLAAGMPNLGRVAVIDAGHGRDNLGTRSTYNREYEKRYTLDWARRLKPLLERKGWRVYLTREADRSMSLTDRVKFADSVDASIFISLHFNAAAMQVKGLETYCIAPVGMPSHFTRGNPDPFRTTLPNNPWDEASFQLAARVHNQMLVNCRMEDRGVRRVRFMTVIKGQKRPAILVEGGYLSNPTEARKINTAEYRQKLAEGIASAL